MRRLQTRGIPGGLGDPERYYNWDFRSLSGRWQLEIDMRERGGRHARPALPEQAAWLQDQGFGAPDALGQIPLDEPALARLTGRLDPFARVPWGAWQAREDIDQHLLVGDEAAALQSADQIVALAPDWEAGRMRRLALLVHTLRDADAALADLVSLPPDTIPAAEQRRQRQSIALLRDDWVAYEIEQAAMIAEGHREPHAYEVLGLARWAAGDLPGALEAMVEGQRQHPGHRDLANREAEILDVLGRRHEALRLLDRLIEALPHAKSIALRGWIRREAEPAAAAADYEAAIALEKDQPVARVGRGLQRLAAGDLAGARADLQPFTHCGWTEAAAAWQRLLAAEAAA